MYERQPARLGWLYVLFVVSGAAGLVYEVVWMRMLAVSLGVTAPATAAVLAAFMGGLAAGAFLGGKFVDRGAKPLLLYAASELVVAAYAAFFPLLHGLADDFARAVYPLDSGLLRFALRFLFAALLLLLPTAAMGATTPAVVAAARARGGGTTRSFAAAYTANVLGAALGTVAGGIWLLWSAGAKLTLWLTAGTNVAVAAGAVLLHKVWKLPSGVAGLTAPEYAGTGPAIWPVAAAAASGALSLACQVLWTRALTNIFGAAIYAFTAVLAAILLAIAAGSFTYGRLAGKAFGNRFGVTALWVAGGVGIVLSIFVIGRGPFIFLETFPALGATFTAAVVLVLAVSFLTVFLPAFSLGMILPAAVGLSRARAPGSRVGTIYAANTAGAIAGAIAATFVIIPTIGTVAGLQAAAVIAAALALFPVAPGRVTAVKLPVAAAVAASAFLIPKPSATEMAMGAGINPSYYLDETGRVDLTDARRERLLFYREGVDASVAVVQYGGIRSLKINGKVVASTNFDDLHVEKTLGELPVAACRDPGEVLVIGLGTGITLGGVTADARVREIVCVELNEVVAPASRLFDRWSGAPLDDRRVILRVDDGRAFVLATPRRFDVITSDPIHPWTRGSSSLFTVEHFRNCRRLLRPGGVMAQWLPLYQLSPTDYLTVVASFARAFAHVALFYTGRDSVLLASDEPLRVPAAFAPYLVAEDDRLRALAARAPVNDEDKLILEYTAPRSLYEATEEANLANLAACRAREGDARYRAVTKFMEGRRRQLIDDEEGATRDYAAAVELWPENIYLRQSLADVYFEKGLRAAAAGRNEVAEEMFARVLELVPEDRAARVNLTLLRGLNARLQPTP